MSDSWGDLKLFRYNLREERGALWKRKCEVVLVRVMLPWGYACSMLMLTLNWVSPKWGNVVNSIVVGS